MFTTPSKARQSAGQLPVLVEARQSWNTVFCDVGISGESDEVRGCAHRRFILPCVSHGSRAGSGPLRS